MINPRQGRTVRGVLRQTFLLFYGIALLMGACGFVALTVVTNRLDHLTTTLQPLAQRNATMLQDLTDAETGLRGFELTGQSAYLQPYLSGVKDYPASLATVRRLAASNATTRSLVETEAAAAKAWGNQFAFPVLRGQGGMTLDAQGKALFDRYRTANGAVANDVTEQITDARHAANQDRTVALWVLGGLLGLIAVAGSLVGVRLLRRVAPPLERVTRALLRMASGDDEVKVAEEGTTELQALGQATNYLADESRRRRADQRRREGLLEVTHEVSRQFTEHLDLGPLLDRSVATIGAAFGVDRVFLRLAEGERLGPVVAEWWAEGLHPVASVPLPEELDSFLNHLAVTQRSYPVDDVRDLGEQPPEIEAYWHVLGAKAAVMCPLVAGTTLMGGVALVQVSGPRAWTNDEVASIKDAAADLARALSNARLYDAQLRLVSELEALDQAKTDFISNVSHELRTPLTSIRGYVEMLRDGEAGSLPKPARGMLEVVERNVERLGSLVEDLLTLSRLAAGALPTRQDPVALDDVVAGAAAAVDPQARQAGIELRVGTASAARVLGDADQLERVVLNLLANGIKFTPPGGSVTVTVGAGGNEVAVTVADDGVGIPEDELANIGTRFFRASSATAAGIPGTGLGLSIVRALVDRHGGRLEVASAEGHGSTFTVVLPRLGEGEPAPAVPLGAGAGDGGGQYERGVSRSGGGRARARPRSS